MIILTILFLLLAVSIVRMVRRPRVITFLAIALILVSLGSTLVPVPGDLRKAQDYAAMQTCRTIALAESQYANDHGTYPAGQSSTEVFQRLVDGNYVSDPAIFYLRMPGKGRATDVHLKPENVCYDVTSGVDSSAPDGLPVVFVTGYKVDYRNARRISELASPQPSFLGDLSWDEMPNFRVKLFFPVGVILKGNEIQLAQWPLPKNYREGDSVEDFDARGHIYRQLTPTGPLPPIP